MRVCWSISVSYTHLFPDNIVPAGQKEKRINRILDTLAAGQDLTADMAAAGFADIIDVYKRQGC